jgi:hypothetical protein
LWRGVTTSTPTRYSSGEGDVLQGGRAAGMGIDPPVSLPIARAAMPSVTEIAALDDEPPGMRPVARSKAFFGVPYGHFVHVVCGSVDGARLVEVGTAGVEVADGEGVPAGLAQGGDQR